MVQLTPYLNVQSRHLVHLSGLSPTLHGREVKRLLREGLGCNVRFIETFEAWFRRRIGQMVVDFASDSCRRAFVDRLEKEPHWFQQHFHGAVPKLEGSVTGPGGQRAFFERVQFLTGIDLVKCQGKPPAQWTQGKGPRRGGRGGVEKRQRPTGLAVVRIATEGMLGDEPVMGESAEEPPEPLVKLEDMTLEELMEDVESNAEDYDIEAEKKFTGDD